MNFKLIQICNTKEGVLLAQEAGIDRIMVDLEIKGKKIRQKNLGSVISNHSYRDIKNLRTLIKNSELMVRINPLNKYSQSEIKKVIELGADRIMLPMFRSKNEVKQIINFINGQVPLTLLLETSTAVLRLSNIL
jgi:citrate lyase beta subunit